jgi:ferrochelatase
MIVGMNEALPIDPAAATEAAPAPALPETTRAAIGVLLVNLGTPDAADAPAVRRYLKEFLSDPRVIENQGLVWQAVLNGVILPIRPRIKAKDYQKIWNVERNESPLKTITRAQSDKLGAALAPVGAHLVVDWAMRYGNPSIESRLASLIARGCERILVIPLYPQYSAATTATVCDEVFRVLMGLRRQPTVRVAAPYYDDKVYIDALASSMRAELGKLSFTPDIILASYHGMPEEYVRKGDPYERHCIETTRLLRAALGYDEAKLMLTFQSRFGRAKWLEPATDQTVKALAKRGVKSLAVVTPGFSADCLETLEEIAVENAHIFRKHGGENFALLPCLNDSAPGMLLLEDMARRELQGWV